MSIWNWSPRLPMPGKSDPWPNSSANRGRYQVPEPRVISKGRFVGCRSGGATRERKEDGLHLLAQEVSREEMDFLNPSGTGRLHHEWDVRQHSGAASVPPQKGHGPDSESSGRFQPLEDVGGVSRGREGDGHVASPAQGLHLSRKDSFIRGVVRNTGQRRSIGAESESSQRGTIPGHSIHQLRCQVLGFGGTATVSEEEGLASSGERLGDFAGRAQDSLFVHGKELPHGSL